MIDVKRLEHDPDYWDEVGAPEYATHFIVDNDDMFGDQPWFYTERDDRYIRCGDTCFWRKRDIHPGSHIIIPRPAPKQWSGPEDGLPPVGTECEVYGMVYGSSGDMKWKKVTVHAHVDGRALAESTHQSGTYVLYTQDECRPLKSEKEKVVEAVIRKMRWTNSVESVLEELYELGALKMPEGDQ